MRGRARRERSRSGPTPEPTQGSMHEQHSSGALVPARPHPRVLHRAAAPTIAQVAADPRKFVQDAKPRRASVDGTYGTRRLMQPGLPRPAREPLHFGLRRERCTWRSKRFRRRVRVLQRSSLGKPDENPSRQRGDVLSTSSTGSTSEESSQPHPTSLRQKATTGLPASLSQACKEN